MEHKSISFEIKANKGKREIEGYASTYEKDLVNDVIQKGAFSKTISERLPKNQIKILWQHDVNKPIGKPIHMEEDSKGLFVVGKLEEGVQNADEALALISGGTIDTLSIGYDVIKDELSDDGTTRFLKELRLYEFSPVTFPANPTAGITASRKNIEDQLDGINIQEMQMLLKEGRVLSAKNIKTIETAINALQSVLGIEKLIRADFDHSTIIVEPNPFTQLLEEMKNYSKQKNSRK